MSQPEFKVSIHEGLFFFPYLKTDRTGRSYFDSVSLSNLFKFEGFFWDHTWPYYIDLEKLYRWPELKQTGYSIDLSRAGRVEIIGDCRHPDDEGHHDENFMACFDFEADKAVALSDIAIDFGSRRESLTDYMNRKRSDLDLFLALRKRGDKHALEKEGNYAALTSKDVSTILSVHGAWDDRGNILNGNQYIFESDELLDQLVIANLLLHARRGREPALKILMALLEGRIRGITNLITMRYDGLTAADRKELTEQVRTFVGCVIAGSPLAPRFAYNLNPKQSLGHFLAGPVRGAQDSGHKRWIPKIYEYLRDEIRKNFKHAYNIDKRDRSLDKISKENDILAEAVIEKAVYIQNNTGDKIEYELVLKLLDKLPISSLKKDVFKANLQEVPQEEIVARFKLSKSRVSRIIKEVRGLIATSMPR